MGFPKIGVPPNGGLIMEHTIKIDDLGRPLFSETPAYRQVISYLRRTTPGNYMTRAPEGQCQRYRVQVLSSVCYPSLVTIGGFLKWGYRKWMVSHGKIPSGNG